MPLRAQPSRKIISLDQLSPAQRDQVRAAGKLYDGRDLPVEARASGEDDGDAFYDLKHFEVHVDGAHAYDGWSYNVDSGTYFVANTTEVAAEVIQFGIEPRRGTEAGDRFAELDAENDKS